jgi:chemotaxis protein histidine kinase CheA
MYRSLTVPLIVLSLITTLRAQGRDSAASGFKVKHVSGDTVFIDAGRNSGLATGMTLTIRRATVLSAQSGAGEIKARIVVAKIAVVSVSNASAMCLVRAKSDEIRLGDIATLVQESRPRIVPEVAAAPSPVPIQRVPANVPEPLSGPWKESTQKAQVIAVESTPTPKSLPEQMAENAKNQRPPEPQGDNVPKSLPEKIAENAQKRKAQEKVAVAATTAPPQATGNVPQSQPQKSATSSAPAAQASAQVAAAKPQLPPQAGVNAPARAAVAASNSAAEKTAQNASPKPPPIGAAAGSASTTTATNPASDQPRRDVAAVPAKPVVPERPVTVPVAPPEKVVAREVAPENKPSFPAKDSASAVSPAPPAAVSSATTGSLIKTRFNVKYVAEDAVYIDGGKDAGLVEGMTLTFKKSDAVVAELTVASVSNTSAVCDIRNKTADLQRGDVVLLSQPDQDKLVQAQTLGPNRKYPQVVAFSEGDPMDEEVRESVPKPPLPEVNRARGRIGVDTTLIRTTGAAATNSYQVGGVVRVDMSRIGGSYWNLNGYWRGRLNSLSSSNQPQSVFDLVNRTYTIGFTYASPKSGWVAGVGRLYLPWAPSLDTTDGGYLGHKIGSHITMGVFAGTAPDPASFNYNPDRRTGGAFIALEGGSFDRVRFTSTEGIAVSGIEWREDRQFLFSENGLFFKRFVSIYHSAQADKLRLPTGGTTEGLARSFTTLRVQPFSRFSIDVNHNYFRDVPTFDPALVGTGLLDKFLFQGLSVGGRLELPGRISLYNNFGQSSKSGDAHNSFNQLYGITVARLWKTGLRGDVRYSKFNSSFGAGNYRAASLSRSFADVARIEVTAGQQVFISSLATPTNYRLLGSTVDLNLGGHYFLETGFNLQRSPLQNFDQWLMTMGYRFDTKRTR